MSDNPTRSFELLMREPVPPERWAKPHPGRAHELKRQDGLSIERNVSVPLRDGTRILIDIYLPDRKLDEKPPVILGWGPYGKHNQSSNLFPEAGIENGWNSPYTGFEAPDPIYWCGHGYAVVYADPRGAYYSEGEFRHNGAGEGEDCYDLIEWLGTQPWSNGKVGMSGVSYLAGIQYLVASQRPPHLAAINPWECFTDWYREFAYHGGIPETNFIPRAGGAIANSTNRVEDTLANVRAHPLWDAYWESKSVDLEDIVTPAFIVASWSDHGLHSRGSLAAYRRIKSKQKYLLVHGRKKWSHYYTPGNVERLRQFFDHFLRGTDDSVLSWPPVSLEIRRSAYEWTQRDENEWPLARTRYVPLYLDARSNSLKPELVGQESVARYDSENKDDAAVFNYVFPEATELTGPMKLRLWVEAESATDMDLFVAIQKTDASGQVVPFMFYACFDNGPVALGWLRVSHRALDEARSTPERPVHSHLREDMLTPGVPVPVDIEIWPSSTYFEAGERLRVVIKGSDVYAESPPHLPFARHTDLRNCGMHIIHTGGDFDSYLLIPVTPPAEE